MTLKTRLVVATILLSIACLPYIASYCFMVFPRPERESEAFKNFDPSKIVEPFTCGHSWNASTPMSMSAGWFAMHFEKGFQGRYILRVRDRGLLMSKLSEDLTSKLLSDGGQILEQSGDPVSGFHFRYKKSHTVGEATIKPLQTIDSRLVQKTSLSNAEVALSVETSMTETWYRTDRELLTFLNPSGAH